MNINTGDYQVEFLDDYGNVIKDGIFHVALYEEAFNRAKTMQPLFSFAKYRIMKCMHNSTDQNKDRWQ